VVSQNLFWWNLFGNMGGGNFFPVFRSHGPYDIFLFQECDDVSRIRDGLGYEGMSIIQGNFALAIMHSSRFTEIDHGTEVVGEDHRNQYYGERGLLWARLKDSLTGKVIFVATHHGPLPIDSGGRFGGTDVANRIVQAVYMRKGSSDEVIVGGDFNAGVSSETIEQLLEEGFQLHASDWVDHMITIGQSLDNSETDIIHGTGSDHRGIKTTWSM